jgi:hypothetical protein
MAGLPGTGLGGIFYILVVGWMLLRELFLLLRNMSSAARWRKVAPLTFLAVAIVGALWCEGLVLREVIGLTPVSSTFLPSHIRALDSLVPALAIAPFAVLASLLLGLQLAALWMRAGRAAAPGKVGGTTLGVDQVQ